MSSYVLYYSYKKFVNQLVKTIENKYNLTTNQVWNQPITKDNKADFMRIYQIMNERAKRYNDKIDQYYNQKKIQNNKNQRQNQRQNRRQSKRFRFSGGDQMQNVDMKAKVDIVKNIFFLGQNKNRGNEKLWLQYWQIFGLSLLILDDKLDVSIFDDIYDKYTYEQYQKINKIMIQNFNEIVGSNRGNNIRPDFFRYLRDRYCGTSEVEMMRLFSEATKRATHQLSNSEKNVISKECGIYPNNKNDVLKSDCTKNMICSFIIYNQSREQLKEPNFQTMASTIRDNILLYYISLVIIYGKIVNDLYKKANQKYDIFSTKNNQNTLNQIYKTQYLYKYQ